MTTLVGTQTKFEDALYELCELDYDAIEAYEAAINRLDEQTYINKLKEFKADHQRHVVEISNLLRQHQARVPDGPSAKKFLTQGKVVLANLIGDETILRAMLTNEEDTNTAYNRLHAHKDKWLDSIAILKSGLEDEKKHKQWIEFTLKTYKAR